MPLARSVTERTSAAQSKKSPVRVPRASPGARPARGRRAAGAGRPTLAWPVPRRDAPPPRPAPRRALARRLRDSGRAVGRAAGHDAAGPRRRRCPAAGATRVVAREVVLTFSERLDPASAAPRRPRHARAGDAAARERPRPRGRRRAGLAAPGHDRRGDGRDRPGRRPPRGPPRARHRRLLDRRPHRCRAASPASCARARPARPSAASPSGPTPSPTRLAVPPDPATTAPDYRTETTADGSFRLDYLRPGPYAVAVVADRTRNGRADAGETLRRGPAPALMPRRRGRHARPAADSTGSDRTPRARPAGRSGRPRSTRFRPRRARLRALLGPPRRRALHRVGPPARRARVRARRLGLGPARRRAGRRSWARARPRSSSSPTRRCRRARYRLRADGPAPSTDSAGVAAQPDRARRHAARAARHARRPPAPRRLGRLAARARRAASCCAGRPRPTAAARAAIGLTDASGSATSGSVATDDGVTLPLRPARGRRLHARPAPTCDRAPRDRSRAGRARQRRRARRRRRGPARRRRSRARAAGVRTRRAPRDVAGADGRFEIAGLRPGPVRLRLFADTDGDGRGRAAGSRRTSPPSRSRSSAEPVVVRARWETDAGDLPLLAP